MDVTPISEYWGHLLNSGETVYAGLIYRVPPRLWRLLENVQKTLKTIDSHQIYTNPCNFHVPVKGLGYLDQEIDRARYELALQAIEKIISEFTPFQIGIRGLGAFPTGVYARVEDEGRFREMNERISTELRGQVDQSPYDSESFVPHVTLVSFNTKDVGGLLEKINSEEMRNLEFGSAGVFEIEVVRANLILALGPEETQDRAYSHVRSFWLGKFNR
ncbi:MAG: 2'-5' RNA ligase family protein [Nitrososphaerota archaeon]|nr:2'-5' RNA ligase family protein [Nitrososphaerota archaeon]